MVTVKEGDTVEVEYTGTLSDGKVFDTSEGREPLKFEVGKGMVIKGFDAAVIGMSVDEEKSVDIPKAEAYGDRNPDLEKAVPKSEFPGTMELKVGMTLAMQPKEGGNPFPVRVTKVTDDAVTLDMNHPLAGMDLTFKIKVVSISSS